MSPFTGREYDWQEGSCAFKLQGCHEAKKGTFVCKNCWAAADLEQREDLKMAYPSAQFCNNYTCWGKPLPCDNPQSDGYYCQKCTRNPAPSWTPQGPRSRSPSMTSSGRPPSEDSTASNGQVRSLIPGRILVHMDMAHPDQIEAMITYAARLLSTS